MPFQKEADAELLRAALIGYERQKSDLEERIADIKSQLGSNTKGGATAGPRTRVVSAAGRRRMAEAQKKRWAAIHEATDGSPAKAGSQRKKRKMSAAGRARIAEATRKRWEAYRVEKAAAAQ